MQKTKTNLKWTSILILIWAGWAVVKTIVELATNKIDVSSLPAGLSADLANVIAIVTGVIAIAFVLPQIYIGVRGLQFLKKPVTGKAHIVWAIILIVITGIALIACISEFFKAGTSISKNIVNTANAVLQMTFFIEFIIYTKALQKEEA